MVVKTFALVKKMSDGRQKRKRRTTLIKSKAALLPPSVSTLIKESTLYSTEMDVDYFRKAESKAKKNSSNRTATARRS